MERWWLRVVAILVCIGTYWSASGLLQFHEVFSVSTPVASASTQSQATTRSTLPETLVLQPTRHYDRLVVVLIDALRADMVLGSDAMYGRERAHVQEDDAAHDELNQYMNFTRSLLSTGIAAGYVAHASVPTVTMPRLKALLSGKPPAFIDILKNFNSAALGEENVIQLMRENGSRVVFYGDDTWLKLFPDTFQRSDGTSGFYTRDTVEVDTNVTRHLRDELDPEMRHPKSQDWDVLVLHYLGLDHVGHLRGPRSPMMKDKLLEMDDVVKLVYESVHHQDKARRTQQETVASRETHGLKPTTLIVLCSDHGMSEIGNHGGATVEEASALMAFMRGDGKPLGVRDANRQIASRRLQVDLVPTIAALFGLRIPMYSTGLLLEQIVDQSSTAGGFTSRVEIVRALHSNLQQLRTLAGIKFPQQQDAVSNFDRLDDRVYSRVMDGFVSQENEDDDLISELLSACVDLQDKVARSDGSEYDEVRVVGGVMLLLISAIGSASLAARRIRQLPAHGSGCKGSVAHVVLVAAVVTIGSLSSSSSVENEHATMFFVVTSIFVALIVDTARHSMRSPQASMGLLLGLMCLVCIRILRERSQVINFARLNNLAVDALLPGNAFANDDSVSIWFTGPLVLPETLSTRWVAGAMYGAVTWKSVSRQSSIDRSLGLGLAIFTIGTVANVWCAQLLETDATSTRIDAAARCVYAASLTLVALALWCRGQLRLGFAEMALWLLASLVQKPSNLPSLAVLCVLLQVMAQLLRPSSRDHQSWIGVISLWIAYAAFFALGNSHLVTTIDISQSYHGLQGYSQEIVGLLTFVNVFSGPLLVYVNCCQWVRDAMLYKTQGDEPSPPPFPGGSVAWIVLAYQAIRMAFYTIIVYFMRFHLFIWSVFAPKMLYEVVFTFVIAMFAVVI